MARAREMLLEVPRTAKLTYCLMRGRRVPLGPKVAVGAALTLVFSPLDVPGWVPVIGDLDMLALGVLTVKVFVDACPDEVVREQRAAVASGESVFDRDLRLALSLVGNSIKRLRGSNHGGANHRRITEP